MSYSTFSVILLLREIDRFRFHFNLILFMVVPNEMFDEISDQFIYGRQRWDCETCENTIIKTTIDGAGHTPATTIHDISLLVGAAIFKAMYLKCMQ